MRMKFTARAAAAALVLGVLAACGGGGGGGSVETPAETETPQPGVVDAENEANKALVIAAVAVHDASTALDRLLDFIGYDRLLGPDGTFDVNCAGGGTAQAVRTAATYVVNAANCKLATNDGFVLDGRWTLTKQTVNLQAETGQVDPTQGRWGYGRATEMAVGINYEVRAFNGSYYTKFLTDGNFEVDEGVMRRSNGSFERNPGTTPTSYSGGVSLRVTDSEWLGVSSTTNRQTITAKLGARTATIRYGTAGVEADVVSDGKTTTVSVPWVDFID